MGADRSGEQPAGFAVLGSQHHYRGWAIDVRTDEVVMPDGSVARRDVVEHPGAVAVVLIEPGDVVVMVRQYRHPVGHDLLELPAGLLDVDGEPAIVAAQRELFEEAALRAADWSVLLDLHTSPGMTDEAIRIYLARGATPVAESERFVAEHEEITMTVERHRLDELVAMALSGALTNAAAVAGVLAAAAVRSHDWDGLRPIESPWPARPGRVGANPG